jgi:hypothetical protein
MMRPLFGMRTMKNALRMAIVVVIMVCVTTPAFAEISLAQACHDGYENNMVDLSVSDKNQAENSVSYSNYCRDDGSVNNLSIGGTLDAIVQEIPFTSKLNLGSSSQKIEQFCKAGYEQHGFNSDDNRYARSVVLGAQVNFNQCVAISASGLIVTHTYNAPETIVLYGHFGGKRGNGSLDALSYDSAKVTCTSTSFGNHTVQTIDKTTPRIDFDDDFSIQCTRIAEAIPGRDKKYYPDVQVTASIEAIGVTSPYAVSVPADNAFGPALTSQYEEHLRSVKEEAAASDKENSTAQEELAATKAELASTSVTDADWFYVGQYDQAGHFEHRVPCPLPVTRTNVLKVATDYGNSLCPSGTVSKLLRPKAKADAEGNGCGYHWYINTCLQK